MYWIWIHDELHMKSIKINNRRKGFWYYEGWILFSRLIYSVEYSLINLSEWKIMLFQSRIALLSIKYSFYIVLAWEISRARLPEFFYWKFYNNGIHELFFVYFWKKINPTWITRENRNIWYIWFPAKVEKLMRKWVFY